VTPADLELLADMLAARLRNTAEASCTFALRGRPVPPIPAGATKATAAQLMVRYQVSSEFVEAHADEWGAEPMSDAPNSKLRYDIATADAWWEARRRGKALKRRGATGGRTARPKPRTHTASGVPRLQVI
jgi:hypothetical protein